MEFYAPWCGHCQQLAPHYREAAKELDGLDLPRKVKLAKYDDGDEYNRQLRAGAPDMYNYTSYPSLFVFDKGEHTPYYGGRTAEDIIFYMTAISKGLDPQEEELKTKPGLYKDKPEFAKYVTDFQDEEVSWRSRVGGVLRKLMLYRGKWKCLLCAISSAGVNAVAKSGVRASLGTSIHKHLSHLFSSLFSFFFFLLVSPRSCSRSRSGRIVTISSG